MTSGTMTISGSTPISPDCRRVARALARDHAKADPALVGIWLARDPSQREVRLIEVTGESPTTMELLAVRFRATAHVPLPSAVLVISPEEWAAIESGELELPQGWEDIERLDDG
jgi:hypothetical protein